MSQDLLKTGINLGDAAASRRTLMQRAGMGAASLAALSAFTATDIAVTAQPARAGTFTPSPAADIQILNFALNLEYLEANYYLLAATGKGVTSFINTTVYPNVVNNTGGQYAAPLGGSPVPWQIPLYQQYADNLAADELAHVQFLVSTLGSNAVSQPLVDLQTSFTTLAVAAGLIKEGQSFNPFADEISFLLGGFIFEDVGVTAYGGALSSIYNPAYLTAAGSIAAIEAYHAATIRTLLATIGAGVAVDKIAALRATLSQASDDAGNLLSNGYARIAPTDSNALAFTRTPRQVLNVVYGAVNATSGLFLPSGANGAQNLLP